MMLGMTSHVDGRLSNSGRGEMITAHLAGGLVGGIILGAVLTTIQELARSAPPPAVVWFAVAFAISGLALAADLRLVGLPSRRKQVPATWTRRFGRVRAYFAYGIVLGVGFATFVPYAAMYSVFAASLLSDGLRTFAIGVAFGVGRTLTPALGSKWLGPASSVFYRDYSKRWLARTLSITTSAAIAVGIVVGAATAVDA